MTIRRITWITVLCAFTSLVVLGAGYAAAPANPVPAGWTMGTYSPTTGGTMELAWTQAGSPGSYVLKLYRWDDEDGTVKTLTNTYTLPGTTRSYERTNVGYNTRFTWELQAFSGAGGTGDASAIVPATRYNIQATPDSVTFDNVTASGFDASTTTTIAGVSGTALPRIDWGLSGVLFNVNGVDRTKVDGAATEAISGLDSNTEYTVKSQAFNGGNTATPFSGEFSTWTLANAAVFADSGADAVTSAQGIAGGTFLLGTAFTFDAVNGIGAGAGKASSYKYFWNEEATTPSDFSTADLWEGDSLVLTPVTTGTYYLHLAALNGADIAAAAVTSAAYTVEAVPELGTIASAFGLLAPAGLMFRRRRKAQA